MKTENLNEVFELLNKTVEQLKNPYVEDLAVTKKDPFSILIATMLSARTKDDVTEQASSRLLCKADTPQAMLKLSEKEIGELIFPVGFYRTKARNILKLSQKLIDNYNSKVPDTIEELLKLDGVGRKTANLVINLAFQKNGICVDTHVHRIVNRWGLVKTPDPAKTELRLRKVLPEKFWIPINRLLVMFGQNVCTPISPRCSVCVIEKYCDRAGVGRCR